MSKASLDSSADTNGTTDATSTTGNKSTNGSIAAFSLANILSGGNENLEHPDVNPDIPAEGWDEEQTEKEAAVGYCVECEGAPPSLLPLFSLKSETPDIWVVRWFGFVCGM